MRKTIGTARKIPAISVEYPWTVSKKWKQKLGPCKREDQKYACNISIPVITRDKETHIYKRSSESLFMYYE
jgi:hypothetical protein